MAGDWIKVEHATVDKPEVVRLADIMGFHPDQAVGLLVRFWVWLDRNLRDDSVTLLYAKTIDAVTHQNGFCGALCAIGWAEIDEKTGIVTIKNVERHNGNPAKTRALTRNRNVTLRLRDRDANTVTREEKIRVSTSLRSVDSALNKPTVEHEALARSLGVDCVVEFAKYRDHFAATGKRHKDPVAGFRNWLRRAKDYKPKTNERAGTATAIFGESREDPHDITDLAQRIG